MSRSYSQRVFDTLILSDPLKWQALLKKIISTAGLAVYLKFVRKTRLKLSQYFKFAVLLLFAYPLSLKVKYSELKFFKSWQNFFLPLHGPRINWNILLLHTLKPYTKQSTLNETPTENMLHTLNSELAGDCLYDMLVRTAQASTSKLKLEKSTLLEQYAKQSGLIIFLTAFFQINNKKKTPTGAYLRHLLNTKRHIMVDFLILYASTSVYLKIKEHKIWQKLWRRKKRALIKEDTVQDFPAQVEVPARKLLDSSEVFVSNSRKNIFMSLSETSSKIVSTWSLQLNHLSTSPITASTKSSITIGTTDLPNKITPNVDIFLSSFQWCAFKYGFNKIMFLPNLHAAQKLWGLVLLLASINQIKPLNVPTGFTKSVLKNTIKSLTTHHLFYDNTNKRARNLQKLKLLIMIFSNYFV